MIWISLTVHGMTAVKRILQFLMYWLHLPDIGDPFVRASDEIARNRLAGQVPTRLMGTAALNSLVLLVIDQYEVEASQVGQDWPQSA